MEEIMTRANVILNFAQLALWLYMVEAAFVLAIVMMARIHT
jgi:hypothetical protein